MNMIKSFNDFFFLGKKNEEESPSDVTAVTKDLM